MGRIKIPSPRIADTLPSLLGDSIAQEVPMRVGNLTDERSVYVGGNKGLVYVHPNGSNPQGVYQAKNGIPGIELRYGAEVMVKRTSTNERTVTRLNTAVIDQYLGDEPPNPPSPTNISDFYYCTLQPTSPPSMYIYVTEIGYVYNGADGWRKGSLSADFSASPAQAGGGTIDVPTTPNSARWVIVQFDPSDASISYKQGSVVDARVPFESIRANASYIPSADSGNIRIGAFQLVTGMTGITRANIKNTPPFIGSNAGSFAGLEDTNISSYAAGDIFYHNGTSIVKLPKGTDDQVLTLASGVPTWADAAGGGGGGVNGGVYVTGSITTASASESGYITFSEEWDNGGYFSSGDTITVPSGKQGYYIINGVITYSSNSSSYDSLNLEIETSGGTLEVIYITTPSFVGSRSFSFTTNEISATGTIQAYYSINGDSSGSDLDIKLMAILVNSTA